MNTLTPSFDSSSPSSKIVFAMQFTANVVFLVTLAATLASASIIPRQAAPEYTQTFTNETAAVQAADFITFGLFDTTAGTFFDIFICACAHSYIVL